MVEHRPDQNRFVLALPGGEAKLAYRMSGPNVMDMLSTFVPSSARGGGNGAKLAEAALNYARDHNFQVIPSCWYIGEYIDAHPEYNVLLEPVKGRNVDRTGASCELP